MHYYKIFHKMKYLFLISAFFCTLLAAQQIDYDQAWMAYTAGRYEEALTIIEHCIDGDTANYKYVFLKGKTLETLYRYDEAITTQQEALRLNPGSMEAQAALATLYLLSGQPALSVQLYELLAAAEPGVIRWKMSWATALQAAGNPKEALIQLMAIEQTDSTNWLVYKNMGDCHFRIDSMRQTADCYYKALSLYPKNRALYGTLMRILTTQSWNEGAIEVGTEAVTIDSTNTEAWKYLGVAYYQEGNTSGAYNALSKTLALGDSSLTTCSHYGVLNHHMANYYEAEKYLLKARQMDPNNMITMKYLAVTYGYTGKAEKGLEILNELDYMIAQTDTIGMQANIQRGYLLRILSRYNEAAKVFTTATKNFPKTLRNFYEVGVCYDMALNKKQALNWYTQFLVQTDPNWSTRGWTEEDLKKHEFVEIAIERVNSLKTDLFFEEEKKQ